MNSSQRVIVNTGLLYANMVVMLVVQLLAVRLALHALGQVDYGIYMLLAGIVAMFSFMNVAMAAATQRYLSFDIGKKDPISLSETFYNSMLLHLAIASVVLLGIEVGGLIYVRHYMEIPAERISAATCVLHCITASTCMNIITVPYEADINANENMKAIAGINILDSLMKLGTAFAIGYYAGDRLWLYGGLMMGSMVITLMLKRIYCHRHYAESHFRWHRPQSLAKMRDIASFGVWNLVGAGCSIARYQGVAVVLNHFFGILINTAYGIAQQVNGLLLFFANTIVRAIRPQVVKSEGAGLHDRMIRLSHSTCKITSALVLLMAVPLFVELEFVLRLWLHEQPSPECLAFCRCFLIIVYINQLTIGLQVAIESVGRIRCLQLVCGSMHIVALPIGWWLFSRGYAPVVIMLCVIAEETVCTIIRVFIARHETGMQVQPFFIRILLPNVSSAIVILWCTQQVHNWIPINDWIVFFVSSVFSIVTTCSITYALLLDQQERSVINEFAGKALTKMLRQNSCR